jgi:hypothetical protein
MGLLKKLSFPEEIEVLSLQDLRAEFLLPRDLEYEAWLDEVESTLPFPEGISDGEMV